MKCTGSQVEENRKSLRSTDDVTEGDDVYTLVEEAFVKGRHQGYAQGLNKGGSDAQRTIDSLSKELTRRKSRIDVVFGLTLIGVGVFITLGTLGALGLI